jgi:hypothetical protein
MIMGAPLLRRGSYEHDLTTLVLAVDSLWGGNVKGDGGERFIADSSFSGADLPGVFRDSMAGYFRRNGGVAGKNGVQRETVRAFARQYCLDDLPYRIREHTASFGNEDRTTFVNNLVHALEIM